VGESPDRGQFGRAIWELFAVDGDLGVVLVQPSPTDIERLRRAR
jgi:hypothetical protein